MNHVWGHRPITLPKLDPEFLEELASDIEALRATAIVDIIEDTEILESAEV